MPDQAENEATLPTALRDDHGQKRLWPMWLAAGIAVITAVAAIVSVVAWQSAEQDVDDAEATAAEQAAQVDQLTADLQEGEDQFTETQAQVQAMRAILQPGTPEALQGVYLQLVQAGCAQPAADIEALIAAVSAEVSDSALLAGRTGWEAAIDREAVAEAIADCAPTDE